MDDDSRYWPAESETLIDRVNRRTIEIAATTSTAEERIERIERQLVSLDKKSDEILSRCTGISMLLVFVSALIGYVVHLHWYG